MKYTLQSLKDAINNSIRSARFQLKRAETYGRNAINMAMANDTTADHVQGHQQLHKNYNNMSNNGEMDVDEE